MTAYAGGWAESNCYDTATGYRCTFRTGDHHFGPNTEQNVAIIGISVGILLATSLIILVVLADDSEDEPEQTDIRTADEVYLDIAPWCKDVERSERAKCLVDYSTR